MSKEEDRNRHFCVKPGYFVRQCRKIMANEARGRRNHNDGRNRFRRMNNKDQSWNSNTKVQWLSRRDRKEQRQQLTNKPGNYGRDYKSR